jgi:hypothetical protein
MRSYFAYAAMALAIPFGTACAMKSDEARLTAPAGTIAERTAAEVGVPAKALHDNLVRYLRGRYTIANARYFEMDKILSWMPVSKFVQNTRTEKRMAGTLAWMPEGKVTDDNVDLYPSDKAGFAVSMADARLPNGNRLVIYADLTPVPGVAAWTPTRLTAGAPR